MSAEPQLPAEWSQEGGDPILSAGMSIAMQWRHLGTDKLEAALKALEPELRRQHKTVLIRLGMQREAADRKERERRSELEVREHQKRRAHVPHMADLTVGARGPRDARRGRVRSRGCLVPGNSAVRSQSARPDEDLRVA
ncbi:hypothetical protein [Streptomyces sp. GbtcB7]|uniref:hypothetical protein n=1 Tax=Streptomyces sp. GbtcB7 TaxID=2824752 RepID=UPI0020C6334D|nr:hypothetical protein [Streptomyces sp. GbtcB7]